MAFLRAGSELYLDSFYAGVGISASRSQCCCDIYRVLTYDFDDRTDLDVSQKTTPATSEAVLSMPFS